MAQAMAGKLTAEAEDVYCQGAWSDHWFQGCHAASCTFTLPSASTFKRYFFASKSVEPPGR